MTTGTSREEFLRRLRATGSGDPGQPPAKPRPRFADKRGGPNGFIESWTALGGTAEQVPAEDLPGAVTAYAVGRDGPLLATARLDVAADLTWPDCGSQAAAGSAVGVVRAVAAAAQTGTVLLRADDNRGRAASLLPPACIFVIDAGSVVDTLGDFLRDLEDPPSQLVAVTGPSRSADIESTLVIGVHGPGEVHAILIG
ncbi:MAG: LUD domain-containing protein [bacterium]|nr:LUD domain-containing protein [bacterium]